MRTPDPQNRLKIDFWKNGFKIPADPGRTSWCAARLRLPWGEFKIEVIFFPRGAPRGDPQGGVPRGGPRGGSGELFGLPTWRKNLRIRPRGYFFMLRSILILPDLEIPLKSQKIRKKRIYKKSIFSNFDQIMI